MRACRRSPEAIVAQSCGGPRQRAAAPARGPHTHATRRKRDGVIPHAHRVRRTGGRPASSDRCRARGVGCTGAVGGSPALDVDRRRGVAAHRPADEPDDRQGVLWFGEPVDWERCRGCSASGSWRAVTASAARRAARAHGRDDLFSVDALEVHRRGA